MAAVGLGSSMPLPCHFCEPRCGLGGLSWELPCLAAARGRREQEGGHLVSYIISTPLLQVKLSTWLQMQEKLGKVALIWGQQIFSMKLQIGNIFGFVSHMLVLKYLTLPMYLECGHRQHANEWG